MRFKILYIVAVICWIIYPVQFLFNLPVTPRQLMALIMFMACVVESNNPKWCDKYIGVYLVYIFFYFISCCIDGYFVEGLRRIIGDFFVAIVAYWATRIICIKYSSISALVYPLLALGLFDAIITICQVLHISFFDSFLDTFQLIGYEAVLDWTDRDMMGLAIPGIMSSPVTNGHFLLLSSILSLYLCRDNINILGVACFLVIVTGSFCAQIRTSFYLAVLTSVFVIYKLLTFKQSIGSFFLLIVFFGAIVYGGPYLYELLTTGSNRYADLGLEANGRDNIYKEALDYIMQHPIFGHYYSFVNEYEFYPHNFFLNAYLHAGIIGFIAIVVLSIKQIILSIKVLFIKSKQFSKPIIIFASIFMALFGNGLTHNISLENGDVMTWLIWGALVSLIVFGEKRDNKNKEIKSILTR